MCYEVNRGSFVSLNCNMIEWWCLFFPSHDMLFWKTLCSIVNPASVKRPVSQFCSRKSYPSQIGNEAFRIGYQNQLWAEIISYIGWFIFCAQLQQMICWNKHSINLWWCEKMTCSWSEMLYFMVIYWQPSGLNMI